MISHKQSSGSTQQELQPVIQQWTYKAQQHYKLHNRKAARYWAEKTLHLAPDNIAGLNVLGRIALDENSLSLAETTFKRALACSPENEETLINLGYCYLSQQKTDSAEHCFQRVLKHFPESEKARSSIAYTLLMQGQIEDAFSKYLTLFQEGNKNPHIIDSLLTCAEQLLKDNYSLELQEDISELFTALLLCKELDHQRLAPLAQSLLCHRYKLNDNKAKIDINLICQDTLLVELLNHCIISKPEVEALLESVREMILRTCVETSSMPDHFIPLIIALGIHQAKSGYLLNQTSKEARLLFELVQSLNVQLQQAEQKPEDIIGVLLIIAMYQSLYTLDCSYVLAQFDLEDWPEGARAIINLAFYQPQQHAIYTHAVGEAFNNSKQYFQIATPHWQTLDRSESQQTETLYSKLARAASPLDNNSSRIVIFSCDAGQHALQLALNYPSLDILVIEPTAANMAYGLMQAAQYELANVEFLNGEIDEILKGQTYSFIECAGWLNYLEDGDAFIKQLLKYLTPEGLVKISLDSVYGNESIDALQSIVRNDHRTEKLDLLKKLRNQVKAAKRSENNNAVTQATWFYETNPAINKIFHQRHFFTMDKIVNICESHRLSFLSFQHPDSHARLYHEQADQTKKGTGELMEWLALEQEDTGLFMEGYHFLCEKNRSRLSKGDIVLIKNS